MVLGTVAYSLFLAFHFFLFFFTGPIAAEPKKNSKNKWWKVKTARFLIHFSTQPSYPLQIPPRYFTTLSSNLFLIFLSRHLCTRFLVAIRAPFVCLTIFFSRSFWKIVEKRQRNIFHFWMSCYFIFLFICSNALIFIYFIILKIHWECNAQCTVNKIWFVRLFFHCFPEEEERSNSYIPIRLLILCVCIWDILKLCMNMLKTTAQMIIHNFQCVFRDSLLFRFWILFHLRFSPLLW